MYSPRDSGFVLNTIYPPLSAAAFLPATVFSHPTPALIAGSVLSLLYFLAPVAWVCKALTHPTERSNSRLLGFYLFLGFSLLAVTRPPLVVGSAIHADAPAIGFAAMACAMLVYAPGASTLSNKRIVLAGLFAVLAIAAKQTMVPIAIVLPIWCVLRHDKRDVLRVLLSLAFWGFVAAVLCFLAFDLKTVKFNTIDIPKNHPWIFPGVARLNVIILILGEFVDHALPMLASLMIALWVIRQVSTTKETSPRLSGLRTYLASNEWILFILIAVLLLPTAILGRIKVGGNLNSYAPPLYFLTLALVALILSWQRATDSASETSGRMLLIPVFLVSIFSPFALAGGVIRDLNGMKPLAANQQVVAYHYALAHPGEAYFPWNPLSTLLAEGRIDHFEYGLFDRDLANLGVTQEHFRAHISPKTRVIAFPQDRDAEWTLKLLPEFRRRVEIPELPGWICYEK